MSEHPRFMQIAAAQFTGSKEDRVILYALDASGRVWIYHPAQSGGLAPRHAFWGALTEHRAKTAEEQKK